MELKILNDIVIIFGLSIAVIFLFNKLKIPPIIGFLFTGILTGPYGLGLVYSVHEVEILAEVGILLLLFTIGIEFSIKEILKLKKPVLVGGSFQVGITIVVFALIAYGFSENINELIFIGFLVALSSTAIVLKIFNDRGEIGTPHGRIVLSILIFQDIIVIPMMLFTPILAGQGGNLVESLLLLVVKGIGMILFVFLGAKYLIPFIMFQIAKIKSREIFLIGIFVICFGVVWITSAIGLSLALGAFLAGLIISESEYNHQALGNILPFRDVFTSFFFVSIGMLLNFEYALQNLWIVLIITIIILFGKSIITLIGTLLLGYSMRTAIIVGLGLAQVGEFSFILAKFGSEFGFLSGSSYQLFLAISILTMAVTPIIIKVSPGIANYLSSLKVFKKFEKGDDTVQDERLNLNDHLVIIGFGINGRNLALAAQSANIPYIILEMNPETVKYEKKNGLPIYYGDAVNSEILHLVQIKKARIAVVAINDPAATQQIVNNIRSENENIYLIVRTRYVNEIEGLLQLGVDEVIPEEFETSVEIFTRVLTKYLVPRNEIEKFVDEIRSSRYKMFRSLPNDISAFPGFDFHFPELEIATFIIDDSCPLINKTLQEADFRNKCQSTVLAIKRDEKLISNPGGTEKLNLADTLFLLVHHENIPQLAKMFTVDNSENGDETNDPN